MNTKKKTIDETQYTTIRIHRDTKKVLDKLNMKNYDEALKYIMNINKK
jgi:hypothetical protein